MLTNNTPTSMYYKRCGMCIYFLKLVLIVGYSGCVRAEFKSFTSTGIFRNKAIKAQALWQQDGVLDKMTCAVLCMIECQCLTFSYSSSDGICLGYFNNVDHYGDMLKNAKGNTVFRTSRTGPSLGCVCKQTRDCRTKKSVCYGGVCLCKPGLYFSSKQNACLRECDEFGDGMDIYKGISIYGYNDKELYNKTLSSCCDLCVREEAFTCLTADWSSVNGKCFLSKKGFLDVRFSKRDFHLSTWSLAQRRCK